jgi:hypothetical protein
MGIKIGQRRAVADFRIEPFSNAQRVSRIGNLLQSRVETRGFPRHRSLYMIVCFSFGLCEGNWCNNVRDPVLVRVLGEALESAN